VATAAGAAAAASLGCQSGRSPGEPPQRAQTLASRQVRACATFGNEPCSKMGMLTPAMQTNRVAFVIRPQCCLWMAGVLHSGASRPVSVGGGTARRRSEDEPHDAGMSDAAEGLAAMARQQSCPPGWGSAAGGDGASAAAGADAGVRGQGAAEGMPGFGWQAYQSGHGGRMEASAFSSGGGNYDPMFAAALAAASGGGGGAAAAPAAALWLQPPQQPTSWEAAQLLQMRAQLHLQQRLLGAWATNQQQRQQQQRQQQQRRQQAAKKKTAAGKASATEQFQSYSWGLREES